MLWVLPNSRQQEWTRLTLVVRQLQYTNEKLRWRLNLSMFSFSQIGLICGCGISDKVCCCNVHSWAITDSRADNTLWRQHQSRVSRINWSPTRFEATHTQTYIYRRIVVKENNARENLGGYWEAGSRKCQIWQVLCYRNWCCARRVWGPKHLNAPLTHMGLGLYKFMATLPPQTRNLRRQVESYSPSV